MAISTQPNETPEDREKRQDAELEAVEYATGIEQPSEDVTPTPTGTTPPPVAETPLTVKTVTGSTADGTNLPANAIDNDPNTRFSSLGIGAFLKLDLGAVQEIHHIDFEWYTKPPRSYNVDCVFYGGNV
jgi:hypothetical protein